MEEFNTKLEINIVPDLSGVETYSNELIEYLETLYKQCLTIVRMKNHDYTVKSDPISNFRLAEQFGITTTENAIMVRLLDKIARISKFLSEGTYLVKDEKFEDTIMDAINYLGILLYAVNKKADSETIEFNTKVE